jgi:hypothetical protein
MALGKGPSCTHSVYGGGAESGNQKEVEEDSDTSGMTVAM